MDIRPTLREVESWPIEDRIRLADAILEGISASHEPPHLSEEFKAELRRRAAAADQSPDDNVTWDQIVEDARYQ